jgi:hypothetical protein
MADDTPTVEQLRLAYDNAVVSTFDAVTPAERLQCEADVKQAWDALIAAVRAEAAKDRVVAEFIDYLRPVSYRDPS